MPWEIESTWETWAQLILLELVWREKASENADDNNVVYICSRDAGTVQTVFFLMHWLTTLWDRCSFFATVLKMIKFTGWFFSDKPWAHQIPALFQPTHGAGKKSRLLNEANACGKHDCMG